VLLEGGIDMAKDLGPGLGLPGEATMQDGSFIVGADGGSAGKGEAHEGECDFQLGLFRAADEDGFHGPCTKCLQIL
jgi:hypothetical protein